MANNRMYLACLYCVEHEDPLPENWKWFLAKYYPNTGWYIRGGKTLKKENGESIDFVDAADTWFDEHKHGGMYGEYITTVFESALADPVTDSKRRILDALTKLG